MHANIISAGCGFRLNLQFITSWNDEETSLCASVFDGRAHDFVDQRLQNHFPRDCLRNLDYGHQIQEFSPRRDRARRAASRLLVPEVGMELVKLLYFADSSPTEIAIPGFLQVRIRDLAEASGRI